MARFRLLLLVASILLAGCTGMGDDASDTSDGAAPRANESADGAPVAPGTPSNADDVSLLDARIARTPLNVTPGHAVSVIVSIGPLTNDAGEAAGSAAADVDVEIVDSTGQLRGVAQADLGVDDRTAVLVPLEVPADAAPGNRTLTLRILSQEGDVLLHAQADAATLRILDSAADGRRFGETSAGQVLYTGRFADTGEVFNANDPALLTAGYFPQSADYRASSGVLAVQNGSVIKGFFQGMLGMKPGESRLITFPPEQGYGPAWIPDAVPRETHVERNFTLKLEEEEVARDAFEDYIATSGQGNASDYAPGDTFVYEQGGNRWTYAIDAIDNATVTYRIRIEPGEAYTLFPFWANGSVVTSVDDHEAILHTTPTTAADEPFTFHVEWPGMSQLDRSNDTTLVVRHDPPEGLDYTKRATGYGQGQLQTYRVRAVEEDVIHVEQANTHPLAGRALTFDVLLLDLASR